MKRYEGLQVGDIEHGVLVTGGVYGFPEVIHKKAIGHAVPVPPGIYVPAEYGAGPSDGSRPKPPWIVLVSQEDGKCFYIGIGVWEIATQDYRITKC